MTNTPNPMFAKFDQVLGAKTPTPTNGNLPVTNRADEIRTLGKNTIASAPQPAPTLSLGDVGGGISNLASRTVQNTKDIQSATFDQSKQDFSTATDRLGQGGKDLSSGNLLGAAKNVGSAAAYGLGSVGNAINFFFAPLSAAVKTGVDTIANTKDNTAGNMGISDIPAVQKAAVSPAGDAIQKAQDTVSGFAKTHPAVVEGIMGALTTAMTAAGFMEGPKAVDNNATAGSTFYHGADAETAASIKEGGFQGSTDFPGNGMVSLSTDETGAQNYANLGDKPGEVMNIKFNGDPNAIKTYGSTEEYTNAVDAQGQQSGLTGGQAEQALNKPYDMVTIKDGMGPGKDMVMAKPETLSVVPKTSPSGLGEAGAVAETTTKTIPDVAPNPAESKTSLNDSTILDKYNRAIRPSSARKSSAGDIASANAKTLTGIKAIARDKSTLSFTDSEGNVIKGKTPTNVSQFSDAISQEKGNIYAKYNDLAKQAGEKGITVDAKAVAKELDSVVNSKSLKITNPKAITYAKTIQKTLNGEGTIDPKTAQEVIQNYNAELKAYYRNPTPGLASNVQIDALIANKFREALDKGITGATGEQYQSLKNEYGALSSIESDVAKAAQRVAKQNNVGFSSNLSNIASGAELVRGLVTMNPADIAISGTIKGIQLYTKYLNNPDVNISKMFDSITGSNP